MTARSVSRRASAIDVNAVARGALARLGVGGTSSPVTLTPKLPVAHPKQRVFVESTAKRKIIRAGRRGGKTVGSGIIAVKALLAGRRVLYATPTQEQIQAFWYTVTNALYADIDAGTLIKNETMHTIEVPRSRCRIRAKTAWNADTLRGDYADLLILDEYQLMNEDALEIVGLPMLLDNNGDLVIIYTPPSVRSAGTTKARDPRHASKLYKKHENDPSGRWQVFHFTSRDNPHISSEALNELTADMSTAAIRQEIDAEDDDEVPGALWKRQTIDSLRVTTHPELKRIVVAVDPSATSKETSDEAGIIAAGLGVDGHGYVLADKTLRATPLLWCKEAIALYDDLAADRIIGETNNGGEMIETLLRVINANVSYRAVTASRGKVTRAEPVSALYEKEMVHHVGVFAALEDEMCSWVPGASSPNRMDALVWALTELMPAKRKASFA